MDVDDIRRCDDMRDEFDKYWKGDSCWKKDKKTRDYKPCKAQQPYWDMDEIQIIGLIINADANLTNRGKTCCDLLSLAVQRVLLQDNGISSKTGNVGRHRTLW